LLISGGALPGMVVNVKITKKKSDYWQGQIVKVISLEVDFPSSFYKDFQN
jgi:tRNA/tmRNA/rRNA uracil-C5-methylase (TrmA/RlmC/RlmD family)